MSASVSGEGPVPMGGGAFAFPAPGHRIGRPGALASRSRYCRPWGEVMRGTGGSWEGIRLERESALNLGFPDNSRRFEITTGHFRIAADGSG